jgi:hypothetical protein
MRGIYYKEGIYVIIDNDDENDICIYHYEYRDNVSLFGGRVEIHHRGIEAAYLAVDGKPIINFDIDSKDPIKTAIPLSEIVAHLNAIETNGADAFIKNYKQSIEFAYSELKELKKETEFRISSEKNERVIEVLLYKLRKLNDLLFAVFALLFGLHTFMSAGLENDKIISVCQSIMDSLS